MEKIKAFLRQYSPTFAEDVNQYSHLYWSLGKEFDSLVEKASTPNNENEDNEIPWVNAWDFDDEALCAGFDNLTVFFLQNPVEFEKFLLKIKDNLEFRAAAGTGTLRVSSNYRQAVEAGVAWLLLYDVNEFSELLGDWRDYAPIPVIDVGVVYGNIVGYLENVSSNTTNFEVLKSLVERIERAINEKMLFSCFDIFDESNLNNGFDEESARKKLREIKKIILNKIADIFVFGDSEDAEERRRALQLLLSHPVFTEFCDASRFFGKIASNNAGEVDMDIRATVNLAEMATKVLSETPSSLANVSRALRECFSESLEKFIDHKEAASSIEKLTRTLAAAAEDVSANEFPQL